MRWPIVVLMVQLSLVACAKSEKVDFKMSSGRGCEITCEWCVNLDLLCVEATDASEEKDSSEQRGEPGAGFELMRQ